MIPWCHSTIEPSVHLVEGILCAESRFKYDPVAIWIGKWRKRFIPVQLYRLRSAKLLMCYGGVCAIGDLWERTLEMLELLSSYQDLSASRASSSRHDSNYRFRTKSHDFDFFSKKIESSYCLLQSLQTYHSKSVWKRKDCTSRWYLSVWSAIFSEAFFRITRKLIVSSTNLRECVKLISSPHFWWYIWY